MRIETRPWGRFEVLYEDQDTWLKKLIIAPGQSLSLQFHNERDEYWYPTQAGVHAHIGGQAIKLTPWATYFIPAGMKHRLSNPGQSWAVVVEWAVGSPTESDIVRVEDIYGR